METKWTDGSRETVLRMLEEETGERAVYHFSPSFAYTVGSFALLRDGRLTAESDGEAILVRLAALGLCEEPRPEEGNTAQTTPPQDSADPPRSGEFVYPMDAHDGRSLVNLVHLLSARQHLLNKAIGVPGAFRVSKELVEHLAAHPPLSRWDFLQQLRGREEQCRGAVFSSKNLALTGFRRSRAEDRAACRQLAERMVAAALAQNRAKPFTTNARNQKYVMKTWLYAIGMDGPDCADARARLLARLPGTTAARHPMRKGADARG